MVNILIIRSDILYLLNYFQIYSHVTFLVVFKVVNMYSFLVAWPWY